MTLAWNAATGSSIAGYKLYKGGTSHSYTSSVPAGNVLQQTLTNLTIGTTYYFAVTAYTINGTESDFSTELAYTPSTVVIPPPTNSLPNPTNSLPAPTNSVPSQTNTVPSPTNSLPAQTNFVPASTNRPGLPLPWISTDIGAVPTTGSAFGTNTSITASGTGVFGSTSDSFQFVYQPISGDGEIIARISSSTNSYAGGVMIRETLMPNSSYSLIGASNGKWLKQRRDSTGSGATGNTWANVTVPNIWVRIARSRNTLTRFTSADGVSWSAVDSRTTSMGSQAYVGLAVSSLGATNPALITFTNIVTTP